MNAKQLLKHFDRIAEAPDAVPRLRRFILDLAVRGKLVEQDPGDEPAADLLKRIQVEKARSEKLGEISKGRQSVSARPDELLFSLMPGWAPARVGQILIELKTGPFGSSLHQSDYQSGGIPVINPASIQNGRLIPIDGMAVGQSTLNRLNNFKLRASDIVMARRGEMGRCAVVTETEAGWLCGTGSLVLRLPSCVSPRFVVLLIGSPIVREYLGGSAVGATMQNLNQGILLNLVICLPPFAEQDRIVAKVDELMALCDRLEAVQDKREQRRDRLVTASLRQFQDEEGLTPRRQVRQDNSLYSLANLASLAPWREPVFLPNIPRLTTRPEHIKALRQTILNLAVRGKLADQDSADEPAAELLNRIAGRKALSTRAGDIRIEKSIARLSEAERPFDPPAGWAWGRLGTLVLDSDSGWSPRTENHGRKGDEWGVLKVSAVSWDRFDPSANKQILPGMQPRLQAQVHKGDFLISRANTAELIARAVLVEDEPRNLMMSDKIVRLHLIDQCDHRYVWLVNNHADFARAYYAGNATGVSPSMKNVSRGVILDLPFPLPPLPEQHRIVAKVDQLMALCDQLEASLTTTQSDSRRLLEAVLRDALA